MELAQAPLKVWVSPPAKHASAATTGAVIVTTGGPGVPRRTVIEVSTTWPAWSRAEAVRMVSSSSTGTPGTVNTPPLTVAKRPLTDSPARLVSTTVPVTVMVSSGIRDPSAGSVMDSTGGVVSTPKVRAVWAAAPVESVASAVTRNQPSLPTTSPGMMFRPSSCNVRVTSPTPPSTRASITVARSNQLRSANG